MQNTLLKRCVARSVGLLFVLFYLASYGPGLYADAQKSGEFSIRAIIPENQLDKRQTYFDLQMNPGDEQTVQIVITNSMPDELVAQIGLNAASTARDGLIVYTVPDVRDDIMNIAVNDVAALEQNTVTVPPHGTQTVNIRLKMPADRFDGVILGGITVTADQVSDESETAQGLYIKNDITYVIALKLTENDDEIIPDFDLSAITPCLVNHRTAVAVTLRNKVARIAMGMEIKAEVYKKDSDKVLHELTLNDAGMAPLSKGDFVIDWNGEALKPGTYRLKMNAVYEGETWEWDEEFTIAGEADGLNKGAVGLKKDYTWLYVLLGVAALALVWILAYRMGKRKKNEV